MYLFFDTETTGLPLSWKAPVTNTSNWPRMVQLAWLQFDAKGILMASGNHIVCPEGFSISSEAAKIHGITTEKARLTGEALAGVLDCFQSVLESSSVLVAHNMSFDEKIVGAEFIRNNRCCVVFSLCIRYLSALRITTVNCSASLSLTNSMWGQACKERRIPLPMPR